MTRQSDIHRRIRIHARRSLKGNGEVVTESHVCCPREDTMVSMDRCSSCAHCEGLVFDGSPGNSYIVCGQIPTPREAAVARRAPENTGDPFGMDGSSRSAPLREDAGPASVGELMTPDPVCVHPDLGVAALRELLLSRGFGAAPVVDERGRPVGIVSKTDLLRDSFLSPSSRDDAERHVAEVMMPVVLTVPERLPVPEAAAVMASERIHRVPVVAGDGSVVGIVSALDVLRWIAGANGYLIPSPAARRGTSW